jgi:hypothetical protein
LSDIKIVFEPCKLRQPNRFQFRILIAGKRCCVPLQNEKKGVQGIKKVLSRTTLLFSLIASTGLASLHYLPLKSKQTAPPNPN